MTQSDGRMFFLCTIVEAGKEEQVEEEEVAEKKRKPWVHEINTKRKSSGEYHHLFPDLLRDCLCFRCFVWANKLQLILAFRWLKPSRQSCILAWRTVINISNISNMSDLFCYPHFTMFAFVLTTPVLSLFFNVFHMIPMFSFRQVVSAQHTVQVFRLVAQVLSIRVVRVVLGGGLMLTDWICNKTSWRFKFPHWAPEE